MTISTTFAGVGPKRRGCLEYEDQEYSVEGFVEENDDGIDDSAE